MALTPKQQRFVAEYLVDLNATQAAIRAGYVATNANVTGPRLLVNVGIASAIQAGQSRQLGKLEITADRVKERMGMFAFGDLRQLIGADGNLKPIHELDEASAALVVGFEVIKKNAAAGDGIIDTIHKIKRVDPVKPLEMLGKHFRLLDEHVEVTGSDALIATLMAGRQRAAKQRKSPAK